MKKLKYIKVKYESQMIVDLHNIILETTNAQLISLESNRLCKKFIKELKNIALSEELQ